MGKKSALHGAAAKLANEQVSVEEVLEILEDAKDGVLKDKNKEKAKKLGKK